MALSQDAAFLITALAQTGAYGASSMFGLPRDRRMMSSRNLSGFVPGKHPLLVRAQEVVAAGSTDAQLNPLRGRIASLLLDHNGPSTFSSMNGALTTTVACRTGP
jgi:hypothetical protein